MEEKNQNIEESNKKDLTQEQIEEVQSGSRVDGAVIGFEVDCAQVDLNN